MSHTYDFKRRRRKRFRTRYVRIESLEPRVVLDGTAQLGVIIADDNAVIHFDSESFDLNYTDAFGQSSWISSNAEYGTEAATRYFGSDVLPRFEFHLVVGEHGLIGNTALVTEATADHDAVVAQWYLAETPTQGETIDDPPRAALTTDRGFDTNQRSNDSNVGEDHQRLRKHADDELNTALAAGRLLQSTSTGLSASSVPLDEPETIQPPLPDDGFLPAAPIAAFASAQPSQDRSPATGEPLVAENQSIDRSEHVADLIVAASGSSSQSSNDSSATRIALSRDRYFATYESRGRAAWTAHSEAHASRSLVRAPGDLDASHARTELTRLASNSRFAVAQPPTHKLPTILGSVWRGQLGWTGWSTISTILTETSQRVDGDPVTSVGVENGNRKGSPETIGSTGSEIAIMLQPYDAVSMLVGVSLISAYVIADAKQTEKGSPPKIKPVARKASRI